MRSTDTVVRRYLNFKTSMSSVAQIFILNINEKSCGQFFNTSVAWYLSAWPVQESFIIGTVISC